MRPRPFQFTVGLCVKHFTTWTHFQLGVKIKMLSSLTLAAALILKVVLPLVHRHRWVYTWRSQQTTFSQLRDYLSWRIIVGRPNFWVIWSRALVGLNSFGNSVLGAITASVTQFLQIYSRLPVTRINGEQQDCERSNPTFPFLWLIFCRVRVVMSYCFMWLICKNNSPKKPFPFKLCFLSPTTMLWVQTWLPTPQTSYFQPEQNQI